MWARTLWPLSSSTLNMALGRGSTTVPSTWMPSSFWGAFSLFLATRSPSFPACGEDLVPLGRDRHGVLEVGRQRTVGGDHGPAVVQQLGSSPARVDHRLDGEGHAGGKHLSTAGGAVIRHVRGLVEGPPNPVAHVLPHYREPGGLDGLLDRVSDVPDALAGLALGDGGFQG